jgi:hypothetical protein
VKENRYLLVSVGLLRRKDKKKNFWGGGQCQDFSLKYKLWLKVYYIFWLISLEFCGYLQKQKKFIILRIWTASITRGHKELIFCFFQFLNIAHQAGLWIRIRIQEGKNDLQIQKTVKNFQVLKCWMFFFWGLKASPVACESFMKA